MSAQRNGFARGTRPASPGNLTARVFIENQERAEAAKRAQSADVEEIRRAAFRDGVGAGYDAGDDAGWDAGVEAITRQLKEAGLDVDAVLALDAEADDAEDAE